MSSDLLIIDAGHGRDRDLGLDRSLRTAVILSLQCDRRAEPGDVPAGADPKGWWGDEYLPLDNDRWGSRLWLIRATKRDDSVLRRAEHYGREALDWMIKRGIASAIDAAAEWLDTPTGSRVQLHVSIRQGDTTIYEHIWRQTVGD